MANRLCTDELKTFFDKTTKVSITDPEAMMSHVAVHLPPIAKLAKVGRIDMTLLSPPTLQNPEQRTYERSLQLFDHNDSVSPYTYDQKTGERGNAHFEVYPIKGETFQNEDYETVTFLLDCIFVIFGRARMSALLSEIPVTDNMTGIPNAGGFMKFGNILIAKNLLQNYMGLFINIKNFRFINQTIGPRNGDKLITAFAQAVRAQLDRTEEIVARLGGDNFMVLAKKENEKSFLDFLNSIQLKINIGPSIRMFDIDVRAGLYMIEPDASMNDVMQNTGIALDIARGAVKEDIVYFRPEMRKSALHAKEVSNQFRQALIKREFVVYYQPKVNMETNTLCGCEALVRWMQSGRVVPPMSFIPILEQEGSVVDLDFYVFEQVCKDMRGWIDAGLEPVRVSSNFSKVHLLSETLAQDILNIIKKYDVPVDLIEIELTEMSSHDDNVTLGNFVNTMRAAGVHTSIDDFGTGYSSVNLLKDLEVDVIKLDKSFLNEMELRTEKESIVIRNIINMIRELGMDVIAEGVETKSQAEFLMGINCMTAQGYLYDKPIPHDEYVERLKNRVYSV